GLEVADPLEQRLPARVGLRREELEAEGDRVALEDLADVHSEIVCHGPWRLRYPSARAMPTPRNKIPRPTVKRLSLYLPELEARAEQAQPTISSKLLGEALGLTDAQVRKDLAYFGQLGHPGVGYQVRELTDRLRQILRADRTWTAAVVGAGNIGRALMAYQR